MDRQLVLQDENGQVVRAFAWDGEAVKVIRRGDTRRLELVDSTKSLDDLKIPFEFIGDLAKDFIEEKPFAVGEFGHLKVLPKIENVAADTKADVENNRLWNTILGVVLLVALVGFTYLLTRTPNLEKKEEALKQEVIKIVKKIPLKQKNGGNFNESKSETT